MRIAPANKITFYVREEARIDVAEDACFSAKSRGEPLVPLEFKLSVAENGYCTCSITNPINLQLQTIYIQGVKILSFRYT